MNLAESLLTLVSSRIADATTKTVDNRIEPCNPFTCPLPAPTKFISACTATYSKKLHFWVNYVSHIGLWTNTLRTNFERRVFQSVPEDVADVSDQSRWWRHL